MAALPASMVVWDAQLKRERHATVDELVQIGCAAAGTLQPPKPKPAAPAVKVHPAPTPRGRLEQTMAQARAWSVDPSVPEPARRQLARSVQAYDAAQTERAQQAELRQRFDTLKAQRVALSRARKEARDAERRAAPLRRTEAWRREWEQDPRGTAIKSLAALNNHAPTEAEINHARACAGYP